MSIRFHWLFKIFKFVKTIFNWKIFNCRSRLTTKNSSKFHLTDLSDGSTSQEWRGQSSSYKQITGGPLHCEQGSKRAFLIARFMGPTWGPSGADRSQVGPMLAPWTLLSGLLNLWEHPCGPDGKWPWCCCTYTGQNGFNEFDVNKSAQWLLCSGDHGIAHHQAKTVPMKLIWSELVKWLLSSGICKVQRDTHVTPMRPPMGKWLWCCTSKVKDSSNELDLEWICLVVAGFKHPQSSRSSYYAHGHAHVDLMGKWPWHCTSTG